MRKHLLSLFVCALSILALSAFSWAQCPEDPDDRGNCDTLNVTCLDCEQTPGTGPWQVRFPLLVTHDQTVPDDSIAGFVIPIGWTRTNPTKYCSLSLYWNANSTLYVFPDFSRSIFRHILNPGDPTDTLMHNRMAQMAADFGGRDWDTRIVDVNTDDAYARLSVVATGTADQKWWEGDRILLATFTYVIEDTMTMCMDTTFWPPTGNLMFSRGDAVTYTPRDNLPNCFTIGTPPAPDFTIEATPDTQIVEPGQVADYTVTLTSVAGFSAQCTLAVTGLPAAASADFVPNPVTPTNTSAMTITTTGATPEGIYPLTVTATEIGPPLSPVSMGDHSAKGLAQVQHSTQVVLKVVIAEAIAVTAPNGGEEWCVGSSENITWTSSGIDTVKIEYSTNSGSNWVTEVEKAPAAPGTYSWTVPNAPSGQCLVKICDAEDGTPCDQSDALFTIKAAPTAPSGCLASDDLCDKVQFSWTDNSGDETGFIIYRGGSALDTVGAGVTSYDDPTAAPGVTYSYCVSAYNDCGESSQCCDDGTRQAPPAAPSDCIASDDLCDKVQFTWTDNSGDETGFYIYRDAAKLDSVGVDVTTYDDAIATPGQTYTYGVSAYNDCGESAQCSDDGTRQAPPAAPSDCIASDDLCDKVQFTWTDNSGDETGFYIYRDAAKLDSVGVDVTTYDDLTATPEQTYTYGVSAYNDCGESTQCSDDGTRQAPPAAPSDCVASDDLCDKVNFTWTDNSTDETKFYIYRDGAKLDSVSADVESYDDLTAAAGNTYRYCVSAYNSCGESDSCCDDGTRQAPPAAPSDCVASDDLCDKVQFTWTDNSGDEIGFYIYRDAAKLDSVGADVTTYDDLTATPGQTYSYCVSAYKDCGESSQCCDNGTRKAAPAAPSGCVASGDLCDRVQFCWADNSGDETGFYIYRDAAKLDSVGVDATCYFDFSATPGITYEYCVTAYNDCGESSQCCDNGGVVVEALTVTSPNGGENWTIGTSQNITWTFDCINSVDIEYSTDGGSSWITEAEDVSAAAGSYSWTVPDAPSTNCLVRICDAADGSPCDQSNAVFTISTEVVEAVTVIAPNGGEVWCVGSTENITWTSTDIDTVKIEYSTDGGSSWTVEVASVPAAGGSYSWTVPDAPSTNCLVSICDAEDGDPCDQSNALFTILGPPADPSACVASDDLCDKVQFTWTDNSGDETGFYIYRDAAKLDSVGTDVTIYDDATATPGQTYTYGVSAYNDCGESAQCSDDGIMLTPPAAPTACDASDISCDRVQFCWQDNSADETGFYIYRDGAKLDSVGADVTCYDDLSGTPGVTYNYCVAAYASCGESDQCCENGTRLASPVAPSDCVASDDLCDGVNFCWTDNSGDETGFYIYRDGAKIDSVGADATCYDDFTAAPGVTYEYCVTAYNECGESGRCCDNGSLDEESITVTSPNGGESWRVGSTEDIEWICSCIDSVMLEYSTDAGASWIPIDSGIVCASGTYSWTIPDTPSDDCLVRVSDDSDDVPADTSDNLFRIYQPSGMIFVDFDIKPGSCPNPLNTKSKGVLPVAILGTDQFDVGDIDPGTVMLEGVSPLRWNWEDVSRPVTDPTDTCDCTTRGGDGYMDMTFKFDRQDIVDALATQMPFADGETRILTVTGMTYAGVPIEGTDCVVILHKGQSRSSAGDMSGFTLGKNYPNPFNPVTDISFTLPERTDATLTIYNVLGKAIKVLVDREMSAGTHTLRWDGRDEFGNPVSSGIYFYRLKADTFDQTMKMVLMK